MEIQTTTQTTNTQEVSNKTKESSKTEFKLNTYDREYTEDEKQYIKIFTKILMVTCKNLTQEEIVQIPYNKLNPTDGLKNNPNIPLEEVLFPVGEAISEESANDYIETYNSLSKDEQMHLQFLFTISTKDKNIDLSTDDKRIENFNSLLTHLKEIDKNRDEYNNEDNSALINELEILLKNFENNIEKKDKEDKAILESYTKNRKSNPLENLD